RGGKKLLLKASPMQLDLTGGDYDMVGFYGKWARERVMERLPLRHGIQSAGSVRGASSHHHNPSAIFCAKDACETHGDCYGISFVYSGEFLLEAERDMIDQTRILLGIHPDNFEWPLEPGESFLTPEVLLTFSDRGFSGITHAFHDFIRKNIVRGPWRDRRRPILINNWEGTYFDFTGDKLVEIAETAAKLGVEMFVMDDGWFGKRDSDFNALGDWEPNEEKLGCTLPELGRRIASLGMKFGIWFEPETISEDSNLYRAHPDWAVAVPGRLPELSRSELILDMSRRDVQDYIIEKMSSVIESAGASYVKWDFNRSVCDKYSHALPAERQGEMAHRFVLGTCRVLEALLVRFPELLIEGCSGGGGRFDCGMLHYAPQIWCSDDTDPIERLTIQYGSSFIYPVNTMGAHVSASPNHQTGRSTPMETRAATAMSGTFGYELDPAKLSEAEKEEIRREIGVFRSFYETLQQGDYYRLTKPGESGCTVWEEVRKDGSEAVITAVYDYVKANPAPVYVKLQGLKTDASYRITLVPGHSAPGRDTMAAPFDGESALTGSALMNRGIYIPPYGKEYQSWQIILKEV
ncbi:MAG: alpha-galactosidase, partial [Lachnospiraceae bacterium]|nr:alpha-galactosidase [Lachnospiraceae bacterium]